MKIRKVKSDDVLEHWNSMFELLQTCFISTYGFEAKKEVVESKLSGLIEYLNCQKAIVFGAYSDDELIGLLWGYPINTPFETVLHTAYISVKKNARKHGVGHMLLSSLEKEALLMGITHIELIVGADNKKALHFYEHNNYNTDRLVLRKKIQEKVGE